MARRQVDPFYPSLVERLEGEIELTKRALYDAEKKNGELLAEMYHLRIAEAELFDKEEELASVLAERDELVEKVEHLQRVTVDKSIEVTHLRRVISDSAEYPGSAKLPRFKIVVRDEALKDRIVELEEEVARLKPLPVRANVRSTSCTREEIERGITFYQAATRTSIIGRSAADAQSGVAVSSRGASVGATVRISSEGASRFAGLETSSEAKKRRPKVSLNRSVPLPRRN